MKLTIKKSKNGKDYLTRVDGKGTPLTLEVVDEKGTLLTRLGINGLLARLGLGESLPRRNYPRLGLGLHVKYFDQKGTLCEGVTNNISGGGMFVEKRDPLPVGTETGLEFTLPESQNTVQARARTVWTHKEAAQVPKSPGMGLEFTSITDRDRAEVQHFVTWLNQQRTREE